MFNRYGNNEPQLSITPDDKAWVEETFALFIQVFGLERLRKTPFILPIEKNFPYTDLHDDAQFQNFFERMCTFWKFNPEEISVKFFNNMSTLEWSEWHPPGPYSEAVRNYYRNSFDGVKIGTVEVYESSLTKPELLITDLTSQLAYAKLIRENLSRANDPLIQPLSNLTIIFFGFGIFIANSAQAKLFNQHYNAVDIPNEVISYANALICYISEHEADTYERYLNENTKELFRNDYAYLIDSDDTLLTKDKVNEYELLYRIDKEINESFDNRNFVRVVEICNEELSKDSKSLQANLNLAFALMMQKKYKDAIVFFSKAIELAPYLENAISNRGFCKVQLGDLENAFTDLEQALEINPDQTYMWRNMGAYYLKAGDYQKALEHFEKSKSLEPRAELINFYLGQTHLRLGNREEAKKYLDKSIEMDEYNYTSIEYKHHW